VEGSTVRILKRLQSAHFYWKIGFLGIAAAGIIHLFFLALFLYLDIPALAAVNVLSVFIYWYSLYGLGTEAIETGDDSTIGWLIYLELIGHNLLAAWTLGREAGFQYYIYIPAFLPFFIINYPKNLYILRTFVVLSLALFIDYSSLFSFPKVPIDPSSLKLLHHINLFIFLLTLSGLNYLYAVHERSHHSNLKDNSFKDPMTGLFNRRYLQNLLDSSRPEKSRLFPHSLILVDIDRFKIVNDTFGHNCGDRIIAHVSKLLQRYTSEDVTVTRWGGDEFLLLFRFIHTARLKEIAESLRHLIEKNQIKCGEEPLKITITLGIATIKNGESFEEALQRADAALYRGKKAGRNRTVFSE